MALIRKLRSRRQCHPVHLRNRLLHDKRLYPPQWRHAGRLRFRFDERRRTPCSEEQRFQCENPGLRYRELLVYARRRNAPLHRLPDDFPQLLRKHLRRRRTRGASVVLLFLRLQGQVCDGIHAKTLALHVPRQQHFRRQMCTYRQQKQIHRRQLRVRIGGCHFRNAIVLDGRHRGIPGLQCGRLCSRAGDEELPDGCSRGGRVLTFVRGYASGQRRTSRRNRQRWTQVQPRLQLRRL